MLFIKDIRTIKITKVKSWAIHFTVDGEKYILHENRDCYETDSTIFKKTILESGKYKLEYISRCYGDIYGVVNMKKGQTYNSINKYDFVLKLVKMKLVRTNDEAIKLLLTKERKIKKIHNLIQNAEMESRNYY